MDLSEIDFTEISNGQFYEIVDSTGKEDVLNCFLENSTNIQQEYLSSLGKTNKIALMFAEKLLPNSTNEEQKYLAEWGKTGRIALMFAKKFLPNSTNKDQKYLAEWGKSEEIREMFSLKNKYNTKDFL